jgi:hypothetical protein
MTRDLRASTRRAHQIRLTGICVKSCTSSAAQAPSFGSVAAVNHKAYYLPADGSDVAEPKTKQ